MPHRKTRRMSNDRDMIHDAKRNFILTGALFWITTMTSKTMTTRIIMKRALILLL